VLVENRPGASGRLAAEAVKLAEPDGTTMLLTASSILSLVPHLYPGSMRFDSFADFAPVTPVGEFPFGMAVGPKAGMPDNLAGFTAWARTQAEIGYGSASAGTALHFLGIEYAKAAGLPMTHIPYRGSAPALQDLMGGQIGASFHPMVDLVGHQEGGRIKVVAVTTPQRMQRFPAIPTFAEQGFPGLTQNEWFGIFLPARTPPARVEMLNRVITNICALPDFREALARLVMTPTPVPPAEFARMLRADWDRWGPIVRDSGFRPED
jgi:tripartite-type tricarboxylate transporter receptor subunit TctC